MSLLHLKRRSQKSQRVPKLNLSTHAHKDSQQGGCNYSKLDWHGKDISSVCSQMTPMLKLSTQGQGTIEWSTRKANRPHLYREKKHLTPPPKKSIPLQFLTNQHQAHLIVLVLLCITFYKLTFYILNCKTRLQEGQQVPSTSLTGSLFLKTQAVLFSATTLVLFLTANKFYKLTVIGLVFSGSTHLTLDV